MKTIRVNSLAEYINVLESINMENYIYRGQNEPYDGIKATGFRPYRGSFYSDKIYDLDLIAKNYYKQIASKLTVEERKCFLAFCQHHGIPTNLIDFSFSPLVALFFACHGKQQLKFTTSDLMHGCSLDELKASTEVQKMLIHNLINHMEASSISEYAQVYLVNKKWLVDITDVLELGNQNNLLEEIIINQKTRKEIMYLIAELFKNPRVIEEDIVECICQIINCYKQNDVDINGSVLSLSEGNENLQEEKLFEFEKRLQNESLEVVIEQLYDYVYYKTVTIEDTFGTDFNDMYEFEDSYVKAAAIYVLLLANLLRIFFKYRDGEERVYMDIKFCFTYQPANLFERINLQKGLFVYQPYMYTRDTVYHFNILSLQNIEPDICIEINNYKKILKELDVMGINLGSIYGDLDNIAEAVVEEYKNTHDLGR